MAAFLHFRANSVGVNLELEVSQRRRRRRRKKEIKRERREDKWTEIKQSQKETRQEKGEIFCRGTVQTVTHTLLEPHLN